MNDTMFGLVKKSRLDKANAKIDELEKKLNESQHELLEIQEVIKSPQYTNSRDLIKIEQEIACARHKYDETVSATNRIAQEIIENAKLESSNILKDCEISVELLNERVIQKEAEKAKLDEIIQSLRSDLKNLELSIEHHDVLATVTPYEYLLDGPASEDIKNQLEKVKTEQKSLIRCEKAFVISEGITWNDSLSKGKARQKRLGKFLVTAFNAEIDNLIVKTTARNFVNTVKKIEKWFNKVNKIGSDSFVGLNRELLSLRLEEQRHAFEFKYKREMEAEDQKLMKASLREEAKIKKEIEQFIADREKEEESFKKELDNAIRDLNDSDSEEINKLNIYIEELKYKLERAGTEKERAFSMALVRPEFCRHLVRLQ